VVNVEDLRRQLAEKDLEIERLRLRLRDEVSALYELIQLTTLLNSTLNLNELLQQIMAAALNLLKAEVVAGLLVDEETGELRLEGAVGDPANAIVRERALPGRGVVEWVRREGRPVLLDAAAEDDRFAGAAAELAGAGVRNVLSVPLLVKDRAIGVAAVINKRDALSFDDRDLELAEALASQASVAIDNARLYARLADAVVTARMAYRPD
jgi:phosphoserine phosphatase RsbU/P